MHTRPCWIEISTRSFEDNFRFLAELAGPQVELLAIVKADAYGHGLKHCAPAAVRAGAEWLGVTSVEEGIEARRLCPDVRILVIGSVFPGQGKDVIRHKLTAVVWDPRQFDELESAARVADVPSLSIHLEIDTGMSRQGVDPTSVAPLLARFNRNSPLRLEGVMTHLFAADEGDEKVTDDQLERMEAALQHIRSAGIHPGILNVGNTAALLAGQAHKSTALASRYDMKTLMRPGLAMYGLPPVQAVRDHVELRPVMTLKTRVLQVKRVAAGSGVSYGHTFVAPRESVIGVLAVGYADGYRRGLQHGGEVMVRGRRAPSSVRYAWI